MEASKDKKNTPTTSKNKSKSSNDSSPYASKEGEHRSPSKKNPFAD